MLEPNIVQQTAEERNTVTDEHWYALILYSERPGSPGLHIAFDPHSVKFKL